MDNSVQTILKELNEYNDTYNSIQAKYEYLDLPDEEEWFEKRLKVSYKDAPKSRGGKTVDAFIANAIVLPISIIVGIFFYLIMTNTNDYLSKLVGQIILGAAIIVVVVCLVIDIYNLIQIIIEKISNKKYRQWKSEYDERYQEKYERLEELYKKKVNEIKQKNRENIDKKVLLLKENSKKFSHYPDVVLENAREFINIFEMGRADNIKEAIEIFIKDEREKKILEEQQRQTDMLEYEIRQRAIKDEETNYRLQQEAQEHQQNLQREARKQTEIMQKQLDEQKRANREAERNARRNDFGPAGCIQCPHYGACKTEGFKKCRKSLGYK